MIRGPASAVWGANAMNGVVNFISKTPRELNGNSATITFGTFDRDIDGGQQLGNGSLFGINGTHARAVNDRWAYKISAGGYTSDAVRAADRRHSERHRHAVSELHQPGHDAAEVRHARGLRRARRHYKLVFAGGYSGTDGIFHTGIGPFDSDRRRRRLRHDALHARRAEVQLLHQHPERRRARRCWRSAPTASRSSFKFNTQTYDFEIGNINTIGTRNVMSYGGNVRYNTFDLSIAPRGDNRTELGAYVQDEIFLNDYVRLNLGARIDKFDNIEDPVFSPRVALILKPAADHAVRVSYNKAFRSPSLINNYLDTTIVNQLNLGAINPALRRRASTTSRCARSATRRSTEESTESFEVGYTGVIKNRATVSAAVYWTKNEDEIFFTQTGRYRALGAAAGLAAAAPVGLLEVLPPPRAPTAPCTTGGLPSEFSYRNLGTVKNKGFELGIDGAVNQALNVFANYSYQAEPEPDFALSEINLPPTHRFNVGFNFSQGRFLGNAVGQLRGRRVLPGRARRALRRTDRGLHAGQRRVRRELRWRQGDGDRSR